MAIEYRRIGSSVRPEASYVVTVVDSLPVACTCADFAFRCEPDNPHACKHMLKVQKNIALETKNG